MRNWKTTVAGCIPIVLAAAEMFLGIDIPGFNMGLPEAFTIAVGFFVASDAKPA